MSKLATLLKRATRTEPAPMGFSLGGNRAKSPGMLVSVRLDGLDPDAAVAAAAAGADTVLLDGGDLDGDAEKIRTIAGAVEIPCGLRLSKPAANATTVAHALGIDYLRIEDDEAPAALLLDEEEGFVLAVDEDASDIFLRTLDSMPIDALFAGRLDAPFSIRRQLELRRLSGFSRKPLIVSADDPLSSEDLECLRDSGVAAVMIAAGGDLNERVIALRRSIETMRPRRRRRGDRQETVAVLPSVGHPGEEEGEDEE
jgi:hypothetical protein